MAIQILDGNILIDGGNIATSADCCCDTCDNPEKCGDCCISENATITVTWSTNGAQPATCVCPGGQGAGAYSGTRVLAKTNPCTWGATVDCGGAVTVILLGSGWSVQLNLSTFDPGGSGSITGDCCGGSGTISGQNCDGDAVTFSFVITVTGNGCCNNSGTCEGGAADCDGTCT